MDKKAQSLSNRLLNVYRTFSIRHFSLRHLNINKEIIRLTNKTSNFNNYPDYIKKHELLLAHVF